jgi:DNA-binding response OmpR family regulator
LFEADPRRRVLVLEDSILVALALEAALADHGYEAIVAGSLAAAEERLGRLTPLAALLDLHLPDGNALALATRLDAQGCKVALCSGMDAAMVPPGYEFAAQFRKPVAADELARWVATAAGNSAP